MAFAPANPTAADYAKPFPDFLIRATNATEVEKAVQNARKSLHEARVKEGTASRKFADITVNGKPKVNVKRSAWERADDDRRATAHAAEAAALALSRAERARYEFMYGTGDELGALDQEAFVAQVEPLFSSASRRAKEHLDALQAALTERAEFAEMLGRVIDVEGGNWGLRDALAKATAHVDAGLVDESSREVDRAVALINKVLGENILTLDRKLDIQQRASKALQESNPVAAVQAMLSYAGLIR
ncbi:MULTISPECIES: hypothetical protein [unclassified Microbacterium]|uniref:hypothetical protein n=1 Tax=unclassified Microbacterium TaxID=2609290 RepID=UPI003466A5E3